MATADIQKIYLGLLGRPADAEGLAYWNEEIENGTLTLEQLRANIVNEQPEFASGPGQLSRTEFVDQLYVKMFGREPDENAEYWLTGEGANVNLDQLVLAFTDGASEEDTAALNNRATVAQQVTDAGLALEEDAATLLEGVTNDPETVTVAEQAVEERVSGEDEAPTTGGGGGSPVEPTNQMVTLVAMDEGEERTYTTGAGDDEFTAENHTSLGNGLTINAGEGDDSLSAPVRILSEYPSDYLMPTLNSVEEAFLTPLGNLEEGASILMTKAPDLSLLVNRSAESNLTVTDVQNQVNLSVIYTKTESPRDFAVRYAEGVEHDGVQYVNLNDADVNLLTVTQLKYVDEVGYESVSVDIHTLDFFLYMNDSSIASFSEVEGSSLSDSVTEISLDGWANLSLGEVWGGLTIDMSILKGSGQGDIDLDLSSASLASGETVTVKVAEFDTAANNKSDLGDGTEGNPKSDQSIKLPSLNSIDGTLIIENMTIASSADTDTVVNDVLDFSATEDVVNVESVVVAKDVEGYSTLSMNFESGGTLELKNVISEDLLFAYLSTNGDQVATIDEANDVLDDPCVNISLIGMMVNEGTFTGFAESAT